MTLGNYSAKRHYRRSNNAEISAKERLGACPLLKLRDFLAAAALSAGLSFLEAPT